MSVDPDLLFVLGVVLAVLSLPVLLASWTHGDPLRRGGFLFITAAGLILAASLMRPGEYTVAKAHHLIGSAVSSVLN